jgi:hypothetical protein
MLIRNAFRLLGEGIPLDLSDMTDPLFYLKESINALKLSLS